ncbi:MAG: DUF4293 domain-containing protein [Mucilaginibacter sp.]|uniref:DUF4293 domain-containing protein n=1 Tax=Mucilaginibacter sp. TaxID=1882438 RepID=UPI0032640BA6
MIQRIQSVWLLLASLAIFALFFFPIAHGVYIGGSVKTIKVDGIYEDINGQLLRTVSFLALTIATIVIGILPLIIIFLYKNRKQQIALGYSFMLVLVGFSFWMSQTVKGIAEGITFGTNNMGIGIFLSSVSIVFVLLAIRAIKSDEKLIKSADRLR